ncbi:hypothetical protein CVT26_011226 [Gymnopilus dilepis]|uniref:Uncharacterized protein n=1 Tax=Gymnopilus dilepis TaxID=231916 RepID=A0A409WRJ0_9AGAR|nr:hypothetical protein CVT26_011226 [Gymnopilus dilepis]
MVVQKLHSVNKDAELQSRNTLIYTYTFFELRIYLHKTSLLNPNQHLLPPTLDLRDAPIPRQAEVGVEVRKGLLDDLLDARLAADDGAVYPGAAD